MVDAWLHMVLFAAFRCVYDSTVHKAEHCHGQRNVGFKRADIVLLRLLYGACQIIAHELGFSI